MATGPLVIGADASVDIGTGHVMRCLALAQAWQDQGGRFSWLRKYPRVWKAVSFRKKWE